MTLLELLVVLVLLAVAASFAVPAWRGARREEPAGSLARVVADGRALAVRRAEVLRLAVGADGRWTLAARDTTLQAGRVRPAPSAPLRLVLSPLGSCLPEPAAPGDAWPAGAARPTWDVAACAPADTTRAPNAGRAP